MENQVKIWDVIFGVECDTKYCVSNKGRVMNEETNLIIKQSVNKYGYKTISLMYNGKKKTYRVNRLVALTFIANPDNKQMVDHIDGNKVNNNVNNLRWATNSENQMNNKNTKGYTYNKRAKKYHAQIKLHGKNIFLGLFETEAEARNAYDEKAAELFGKYYGKC